MKKQKTQSKIIVALTAVVILLVAVSATLTFAYFTATSSNQSSTMTFGTLSIDTEELAAAPACVHTGSASSLSTLVPGCQITLGDNDAITVSGNIDALLRATLTVTVWQTKRLAVADDVTADRAEEVGDIIDVTTADSAMTGYDLKGGKPTIKTTITNRTQNASTFAETVFNSIGEANSWTYNTTDNKYYYNKVVNASAADVEVPFVATVALSTALGNIWQGAMMEVGIVVDAIQAEHLINGSSEDIAITTTEGVITGVTVDGTSAGAAMANWIAAIATASAWAVDMQTGV